MRDQGHDVQFAGNWRRLLDYDKVITEIQGIPFENLPTPDRILTKAMDPKYQNNGNFKHTPGTYTLAMEGCWYGKCSFCVEKNQHIHVRSVSSMIQELGELYTAGYGEVFDDSATFPDGDWLRIFCAEKISAGLRHLPFSCNARIDGDYDWEFMKMAGFRMVLFGIESANQKTLNRLKKGINYEEIIPTIKQAARAGLSCHGAIMVGYPWESDQDTDKTIALVHHLLRKGYLDTAQASVYTVDKTKPKKEAVEAVRRIYGVWRYPDFWYNKIRALKRKEDWAYFIKQIKTGIKEG